MNYNCHINELQEDSLWVIQLSCVQINAIPKHYRLLILLACRESYLPTTCYNYGLHKFKCSRPGKLFVNTIKREEKINIKLIPVIK